MDKNGRKNCKSDSHQLFYRTCIDKKEFKTPIKAELQKKRA